MMQEHVFHRPVYAKLKLIYGVGINDADYPVKPVIKLGSKKRLICPFYMKWKSMLERCYSEKYQMVQPTYSGCSVCEEWKTFSNFKSWMLSEGYEGDSNFELDKDLLIPGNKVYSPETCVIIHSSINRFVTNNAYNKKSKMLIGVSVCERDAPNKFRAYCNNPFSAKGEYLGAFNSEMEAHLAWKKRKHELACQLADLQTDPRAAEALRVRYL